MQPHSLPLTGLLSLAGPENKERWEVPYFEDVLAVPIEQMCNAKVGEDLNVFHMLGVHGSENLKLKQERSLPFIPSSTLEPILSYLKGDYKLGSNLEYALDRIGRMG